VRSFLFCTSRGQLLMVSPVVSVKTSDEVRDQLEFLQSKLDCCLVIDGESLQV
jgi:phospholipid-translocating ATPase